jgi:Ca-activated chloride channel homolog
MSSFHFANPAGLAALFTLPLLWLLFRHGDRGRLAAIAAWDRSAALPRTRRSLVYAAALLLAFGLARPTVRTSRTEAPSGGDVVFLLDVSRSMLANDAVPSRLARAKEAARSLAAEALGQRVALVVFSGSQSVECPLTPDHEFFLEALAAASRESVSRGGSALADAIRFSVGQVFDDVARARRTIVVLSDGGDPDAEAATAARAASALGIGVVAVGFGAEGPGALVPESAADPTPVRYQGNPVLTRLNAKALRAIAHEAYVHERALDPGALYREWMSPKTAPPPAGDSGDLGWVVCLALAAALLSFDSRRRIAVALLLSILLQPPPGSAQTVEEWFGKGMEAFRKGNAQEAMHYFGDTSRWAPEVPEIRFNLAKALYEFEAFEEAGVTFDHAARLSRDRGFQAKCRLGQGNALFRDAELYTREPSEAIERFGKSVKAYREALRLDPRLPNAAHNIEVAARRLDHLRDRLFGEPPAQRPEQNPKGVLQQVSRQAPAARKEVNRRTSGDRDW